MYRYLFLIAISLAGTNGMGQNFRADSLLMLLDSDPNDQSIYLQELQHEYESLNEVELLKYLKKTIQVIDNRRSEPQFRISAFRTLGAFFWTKSFYSESLNLYDRSVATALEGNNLSEAGISYIHIAQRFMESEMYPQALERIYKAHEYFLRANDILRQANAHSLAATIGFRAQNFVLAVEEVEKALTLFKSLEPSKLTHADSFEIMNTLNTCGLAHAGLQNDDKAMACYAEAEQYATLLREKFWIGLINGNKSQIYAKRGQADMAISSLQIDLQQSKRFRQWRSALSSSILLADMMIDKGQWSTGKLYLDTAEQFIKKHGASRGLRSRYYKNLSKVLDHQGRVTQAWQALLRHEEISDSLEAEQQATSLTRIKTAHDIQQKETEIELLTAENKIREQQVAYRNIIVGAAAITILLLFVLAYVIFRHYQDKKKDNELLLSRNNEIRSINEELRSYADTMGSQNQVIQRMNEDLELRVKKRTHELEEINAELDMFLYRASHDIRRPITTLLGLSNLAHSTLEDTAAVEMFDKVAETASHMDRMLHKLQMIYALNRPLGTGTRIQLRQAINNVLDKFSREMKRIGMDYRLSINDSVNFTGDESLFSIIFQNLIENAITFRKSDELEKPHLWFEAIQLEEQVIVKIRDNGIGIESDYIERIFDLHFRGTALSRGNGLGLYLVKKALLLLKGRIEVVSEYGVGSNFIIYFPRPS